MSAITRSPDTTSRGFPVVIGGVGGGGTRVVSQLLDALGFNLGPVSLPSLDNVLFTTLFTIPTVARAPASFAELDAVFLERDEWWDVFTGATSGAGLAAAQVERVERLVEGSLAPGIAGSTRLPEARKTDLLGRVRDALAHCRAPRTSETTNLKWGWKEPNTSVFLPQIARRFPEMRYVHVIRHGLDMAYSDNLNQVRNWGPLFGMEVGERPDPESCLDFWVRTNERTIGFAREALDGRFTMVKFDDLVKDPEPVISSLCTFLDVEVDKDRLQRLSTIPSVPRSLGRYREHEHSQLDLRLVEKVAGFGFET